ncbi:MAG: tetratricopeptide repeat protein [Trueperaceae bacterium]
MLPESVRAGPVPSPVEPKVATAVVRAVMVVFLMLAGTVSAQTQLEQMRDLLARGYYNSAARVIGPGLVESQPDSAEAHYLYSRSLYLTGDLEAARTALDRALELRGTTADPDYNYLDGLLRAAAGDLDGGARLLRNAFVRSQDYDHAMDWGRVAWRAYRLEEALQAFEAAGATQTGSRLPWPNLNRGRVLAFLGRTDEAISAYRSAIEVFEQYDTGEARPSPAYVEAYFRLGEIYEARGAANGAERFLQLAADHYRAALTGDPNYAPAIEALDSLTRRLP